MPVIDKISLRGTTYDINDTGARANKVDNSVIAPVETGSTASHAYAEGEYFIKDNAFCTAIDNIDIGDTLTENTNYIAGQLIDSLGGDLSNYVQKSETEGLIKNDGTVDENKYVHLQPNEVDNIYTKTLNGHNDVVGDRIWTDNTNIYYSFEGVNYILDKTTNTLNTKTLNGMTNFNGTYVLTDGDNVYFSNSSTQKVLDKSTNTLSNKTLTGLTTFDSIYILKVDDNIYYSRNGNNMVLDKTTSTLSNKVLNGLTNFNAAYILTDGENIYYSNSSSQYVLDKNTDTLSSKTLNGMTSFDGRKVLTNGTDIYYSYSGTNKILDKTTSTLTNKSLIGLTNFDGVKIWSDGNDVYCSIGANNQYVFESIYPEGFVKTNGTIDTNNYIEKSETEGLVMNDGTIDTSKHVHLQPTGSKLNGELEAKTWNGLTNFNGANILTDGDNIYYSYSGDQYVLDKSTSTWNIKSLTGLSGSLFGEYIWTDEENIYYSYGSNQYVLDKSTSTLSAKTLNGSTDIQGTLIWTDGDTIYYSKSSTQYVLNKSTSTLSAKTWNGLTSFDGEYILKDGDNIYYSSYNKQYILDKSTSTWNTKTWYGLTSFYGTSLWTDGDNIYYSAGSTQYVLDKSTSTLNTKTWSGFTEILGGNIWTDGNNIYHSASSNQYIFNTNPVYGDGLVKSDGTIIIPDNSTITISNGVISAAGGVDASVIGPVENAANASEAYSSGDYFMHNGVFCKAITDISSGASFSEGSNYDKTNVASVLKKSGSEIKVVFDRTASSSSGTCLNYLANLYNTYMKQDFPENQDVIDLIKRALSKKYCMILQPTNTNDYIFLQFTNASVSNNINALTFTSMYGTNNSLSFSSNTISCNAYILGTNRSTSAAVNYMYRIILIENC